MTERLVLNQPIDELSTSQKHDLGTRVLVTEEVGGVNYQCEYIYVTSGAALEIDRYCSINGDTPFEVEKGYTATELLCNGMGISMVAATAAGEFLWLLRQGVWKNSALTTTALGALQATAATGVLVADDPWADLVTNVGWISIDDVAVLNPPGQSGKVAVGA